MTYKWKYLVCHQNIMSFILFELYHHVIRKYVAYFVGSRAVDGFNISHRLIPTLFSELICGKRPHEERFPAQEVSRHVLDEFQTLLLAIYHQASQLFFFIRSLLLECICPDINELPVRSGGQHTDSWGSDSSIAHIWQENKPFHHKWGM